LLSPSEKWFIFSKSDTLRKELYCSEPGKDYIRRVPVMPSDREICSVGLSHHRWSPDGALLAVQVESQYGSEIAVIDFAAAQPRHLESFPCGSHKVPGSAFQWATDHELLYVDPGGRFMSKRVTAPAVELFYPGKHLDAFQVGRNGVVLYRLRLDRGKMELYRFDLETRMHSGPLFRDIDITAFDLSPTGRHAVCYRSGLPDRNLTAGVLVDLEELSVLSQLPLLAGQIGHPVRWSPDGNRIAFLESKFDRDPSDKNAVPVTPHFIVHDVVTGQRSDKGIGVFRDFAWSPNGGYIIHGFKNTHERLDILKKGVFAMRISDGAEIGRLSRHGGDSDLAVSATGRLIVWEVYGEGIFIVENPWRDTMVRP